MSFVPAMDLRPANGDTPDARAALSDVAVEQAVLGILLYDNGAFDRIEELAPEHFYEAFHGRLFERISSQLTKGLLADPTILSDQISEDAAYTELGGLRYLCDLVDRAPPTFNIRDYARIIHDLAMRRRLLDIAEETAAVVLKDRTTPAREHIETAETKLYALAEQRRSDGFQNFEHHLMRAVDMVAEAVNRDGGLSGLSTGLIDLDQRLGGLHPTDLLILAGRPSMGKTALATNIAFHVAKTYQFRLDAEGNRITTRGGRVGFFSLEMSGDQLALRIAAQAAGISGDRLRKGELEPHEFGRFRDAALLLTEIPLHIDDTGGLSIAKLTARARRLKRTKGLDLIVVDYLQLVDGNSSSRSGANRVEQITTITVGLKALAKELQVPVLALSQLSRQVETREDKKPQLSDLRESGSIEQDADAVLFVYRESYYLGRLEPKVDTQEHLEWQEKVSAARGVAEVIIGKQRHGPIGTVRLSFNEDLTAFGNLARANRDFGAVQLPYAEDP